MKKIILAVVVLTFLLSSCASTGGCGGSYVQNYNKCPAYH